MVEDPELAPSDFLELRVWRPAFASV